MKRKMMAALLAAALALGATACGSQEEPQRQEGLWYETTGISPDAALFTLYGRDVKAERFFYWLAYTCDYISTYYKNAGGDADWNETAGGQSLQAYVMQTALESTVLYETVEAMAETYGCEITEQDKGAISMEWDAMAEQYGGEEAYLAGIARMGLDRAAAERMAEDQYLYSHLYDLYCKEGSALYPTEDDLQDFTKAEDYLAADHILISTLDLPAEDSAGRQACRQRAEDAAARLRSSADPAGAFAQVAAECSDEDREEYPAGYTFAPGDGVMPEDFVAAVRELKENEISPVIELDSGYCIILRKPLDMDTVRMDYFDNLIQTAAKSAEIRYSADWEQLTVPDFYAKLLTARSALSKDEAAATE